MTKKLFVLTLIVASVGVVPFDLMAKDSSQIAEPICTLGQEDYSVYSALEKGLGGPEDPEEAWEGKETVIIGTTATAPTQEEEGNWRGGGFRSKSKAAPAEETLTNFKVTARSRCALEPHFGDPKSYTIIPSKEVDGFFSKKGDGWKRFYEKYPKAGGFWQLSRPGYNRAGTEAVLYVIHSCGYLCGTGHLYFLTKENQQWSVKNRLMLWIS